MRNNLPALILASIAVVSGMIVLLGYFIPLPILFELRGLFIDTAVILAAVAALVGVLSLFRVHWQKLRSAQPGAPYSAVLLIALALTLVVISYGGINSTGSAWIYNNLLVPIETSLTALLAVTLIYAFARLFHRRLNLFSLIFAATVLFVLVTAFAWSGFQILGLSDLRSWLTDVMAVAGARGILLGVALGVIATGLRVLIGADRPYSR